VGPKAYNISQPVGLSNTYEYTKEGYYNIGYTLVFEDDAAAGCSGKTFDRMTVLKMERTPNRCVLNAETPKPTMSPTVSAGPTVSSSPTTDAPVDDSGSAGSYCVGGGGGVRRFGLFVVGLVASAGSIFL